MLLEVETDKAQMDVEAQDDGKMAKIMVCLTHGWSLPNKQLSALRNKQSDGAKGIKVGTRIAVVAEADDDLSTLSIPTEESASNPSPQEDLKTGIDASKSSESQAEAPPSSKSTDKTASTPPQPKSKSSLSRNPTKQTYPLYPSVVQLLHEKGIPSSDADKIPASGPKGRLLKGDVLAYLGSISSSYPSEQSARLLNLSHLDLSKITLAPPKATASPTAPSKAPAAPEPESDTQVAVSISLKKVLEVQDRIQSTLGIALPLSTFIARATEFANDDLPRSADAKPTADELFNQVLGLDKINPNTSQGNFIPQITALPSTPFGKSTTHAPKKMDIIDILAGNRSMAPSRQARVPPPGIMASSGSGETMNVFSVSVAKGEEKRARVFLERVKTILQVEPGRLVL